MLDRTYTDNGLSMRLTYNPDTKRYKGKILNHKILGSDNNNSIYGDTENEVLESFHQLSNKITESKE
jgi:hypothetical protein